MSVSAQVPGRPATSTPPTHVQPVSAGTTQTPQIIYVKQPFSWAPVLIATLAFVFSMYSFWANSIQKVREREASWYHKVVVDYLIEQLTEFYRASADKMCKYADECAMLRSTGNLEPLDKRVSEILAELKGDLANLNNKLMDRLAVFDESLKNRFLSRVDVLENEVSSWFDKFAQSKAAGAQSSLDSMIMSCQTDLIRLVFNYEFSRWSWPRLRRTLSGSRESDRH